MFEFLPLVILVNIIWTVGYGVYLVATKKGMHAFDKESILHYLFICYCLTFGVLTLYPMALFSGSVMEGDVVINMIPFKNITYSISTLGEAYGGDVFFHLTLLGKNLLGNFMLLLPIGLYINYRLIKPIKGMKALLLGVGISLIIESVQLLESHMGWAIGRVFDIDDLILNGLGFFIGCSVILLMPRSNQSVEISSTEYIQ